MKQTTERRLTALETHGSEAGLPARLAGYRCELNVYWEDEEGPPFTCYDPEGHEVALSHADELTVWNAQRAEPGDRPTVTVDWRGEHETGDETQA